MSRPESEFHLVDSSDDKKEKEEESEYEKDSNDLVVILVRLSIVHVL